MDIPFDCCLYSKEEALNRLVKYFQNQESKNYFGLDALGMTIVMPCVVVGGIGTVLHTIGGCVYKRGLVLAGLICECVSIILMFLWGMYYIPAIVLGFIGYAKMHKKSEI